MVSFSVTVLSTFLLGSKTSDGGATNPKCGSSGYSVPGGEGKSFFCRPPVYGRYVTIRSLLDNALTLCEVEVYSERRGIDKKLYQNLESGSRDPALSLFCYVHVHVYLDLVMAWSLIDCSITDFSMSNPGSWGLQQKCLSRQQLFSLVK